MLLGDASQGAVPLTAERQSRRSVAKGLQEQKTGSMARPMQDTVVSSTSVTSSYANKQTDPGWKATRFDEAGQRTVDCCCSWESDFTGELARRLAASTNYQLFKRFLTVYATNAAKDAIVWSSEPSKLAQLKEHAKSVLLYYHFYWHDCKERVGDHYFYLHKVSDILVVYVNLELELFDSSTTAVCDVSRILLNALYIFLNNSEEHIFKVLLKSKLASKSNNEISSPIFDKCFSNVVIDKPQITSITYVRYILALKLWKSISDDEEEIKRINDLALKILGSTVPLLSFNTLHFFPEPPEKCIHKTSWYLQTRSFDLTESITSFLKFEENLHDSTTSNELDKNEGNKSYCHIQIKEGISLNKVNKRSKLRKQYLVRRKNKMQSNEITFIDLVEEDDHKIDCKAVRPKRNLRWLKHVKMKSISENPSCAPKVKTADSTFDDFFESKLIDSTCDIDENSSLEKCENFVYDFSNIFENSDIMNFERNQKSSDLFDDCFLSNLEPSSSSSGTTDTTRLLIPNLLDFNPNDLGTLLSDFSGVRAVVNPRLTRKNFADSEHSSLSSEATSTCRKDSLLATPKDGKNQLLTELESSFALYDEEEGKANLSLLEESMTMMTSNDEASSNSLGLDSDVDFSRTTLMTMMDEYDACLFDGTEPSWKKQNLNDKEKVKVDEVLDEQTSTLEDKKKRPRRKKSTLKTEEPSMKKMRMSERFTRSKEVESFSLMEHDDKLEEFNSDFFMREFSKSSLMGEYSFTTDLMALIDKRHWKKKLMKTHGRPKKGKGKSIS